LLLLPPSSLGCASDGAVVHGGPQNKLRGGVVVCVGSAAGHGAVVVAGLCEDGRE